MGVTSISSKSSVKTGGVEPRSIPPGPEEVSGSLKASVATGSKEALEELSTLRVLASDLRSMLGSWKLLKDLTMQKVKWSVMVDGKNRKIRGFLFHRKIIEIMENKSVSKQDATSELKVLHFLR